MTVELMDYADRKIKRNIGKKEDVARIIIEVISGDEIAKVVYKDFSIRNFDSSDCRLTDYYDDEYELYDFQKENNLIDNPIWQGRESSYDDRWRNEERSEA